MYRQLLSYALLGLSSSLLYAQTGPAGVGNSATNILWLDAQNTSSLAGSLVNDDPVTTWSDVSGNGNDFVQQSTDAVPIFRNDGLSSGSFNVVRFDGTERYLVHPDDDDFDLNLDEFTILGVFYKGTSDDNPRGILSKRVSYGSQESYYLYSYTSNSLRLNTRTSGNTGVISSNPLSVGDNLFSAIYDGALQSLYVDTDQEASGSKTGTINNSTSSIYLGALNNNYGTYFDGEIAELIMYRTALNGGERLLVENYLAEKYGLSISNDFFGNSGDYVSTYNADLRGIGTGDGNDIHDVSGFSSGLQLEAVSGLDNTNEFAIFAHDPAVSHADGVTSNIAASDIVSGDITERWEKDYFMEVSQGGVLDAATVETKFVFDFSEAGLTYSGSSTDYVLLYRATTSDDFTRVFAYDYALENSDQIVVSIPASRLKTGYYTLGRGTQVTSRKWYVLQNGDWDDSDTWTLDAGSAPIPNNPGSEIPGSDDDVIIRSGKTVTMISNDIVIGSITVDGTLVVGATTGHNFNQIDGQGTIRISGDGSVSNFPDGITTSSNGFGNPANGGLLSVRGGGFVFDEDETFKDVRILLDDPADVVELGADLTINGDFNVRYGTLQFGDGTGTNRTLTVLGDFKVENNGGSQDGRVLTAYAAASSARHEFNLYGDFLNEGTAQFSDRTSVNYSTESTNGVVDLNLVSTTADQQVDCNGLTYFYRIEIDKGSTDFTAFIQADDPNNFILTGSANYSIGGDVTLPSHNQNAFGLITGTASLGTNVTVRLNITGNYSIGTNAKLLVNGATVAKTGGAAITPYGIIEVAAGYLEATPGSGITTREAGQLIVTGGEVWMPQFRTSIFGSSAQGGYQQDGGSTYIGDFTNGPVTGGSSSSASNDFYTMSLTYAGNSFDMSGGTLYVQDQTSKGLVFINCDPDNISVTGGTVVLTSSNSLEAIVTSKAPFYNATLRASSGSAGHFMLKSGTTGTSDSRTLVTQDLRVVNDLIVMGYGGSTFTNANNSLGDFAATLEASSLDDLGTGDTSDDSLYVADVYIGGSFYIGQNANYVSAVDGNDGNSSVNPGGTDLITDTYFYQSDATLLYEYFGWDNNSALSLGHVTINRTTGNEVRFKTPSTTGQLRYDVFGDVEVLSGTLDQHASSFRARAGYVNNDRLGTYYTSGNYPVTGGTPDAAIIMMFADDVTVDEDGAIFGNVELNVNHNYYLEFIGDVTFERLEHARGNIYIGSNNLKIDEYLDIGLYRYTQYTTPLPGDADETWIETPAVSSLLRVEDIGRYDVGEANNLDQRSMIITDGNASDGGLSIKVTGNSASGEAAGTDGAENYDNINQLTYPIAFTTDGASLDLTSSGNVYYRPAQVKVSNFSDDGYITIRPVSGELKTTDLSGGEVLQHYWSVTHSDFTTVPTVAYRFYYRNREESGVADLPTGSVNESSYVPGKVLLSSPYTRSYESSTNTETDLGGIYSLSADSDTRVIIFNGDNSGTTDDDLFDFSADAPGITLENANYTAGESTRFVGAPTIYYSRKLGGAQSDQNWTANNAWSLVGVDGTSAGNAEPGAGDVAIIGRSRSSGETHRIRANVSLEVAAIVFEEDPSPVVSYNTGRLFFDAGTTNHKLGAVSGEGEFQLFFSQTSDIPTFDQSNTDLGQFVNEPNSIWNVSHEGSGGTGNIAEMPSFPSEFPNLRITASGATNAADKSYGSGSNDINVIRFNNDIVVNESFTVGNKAAYLMGGDIQIGGDLQVGMGYGYGSFYFPNDANAYEVEVTGDVEVGDVTGGQNGNCILGVLSGNTNAMEHTLRVGGDITLYTSSQNSNRGGSLNLYNSSTENNVLLELFGDGTNSFANNNSNVSSTSLYKIKLNKGGDIDQSFSINNLVTLPEPIDIGAQSVEIVNGLLLLNDPSIDVVLADGTQGNFYLPNTNNSDASSGSGGLEVRQGTVSISGDDIGIVLDGLLRISGGTVDLSITGDNGNNFIEYGASDNAEIELSSGSLLVGSQVRRKLTAVTGLLNYSQTGGVARFGIEAAPESTRGVFEIRNSGSEFTHTGGEFTIVRQNASSTVGTLIMKPDIDDLDVSGSTITFGNSDTPVNQGQIGIDANVPLNKLVVTGNNSPSVIVYNTSLELDSLTIEAGATFLANGYDLTINADLVNDGLFDNGGTDVNQQTTNISSSSDQTITGTGTTYFYNLTKDGSSTLDVQKDITVENDFEFLGGTLTTGTYAVNVEGDMTLDGIHQSNSAGPGIVFNGSGGQNLDTSTDTGEFGVMTLDNSSGLEIPGDGRIFQVNDKIILTSGVFNIGGNLLIMNEDAIFENGSGGTARADFNDNSMISVNASITDNGVRKVFSDTYVGSFLYPVGLNYYTPAEINITGITGGDAGYLTVKPVEDIAGGISDDSDETCFGDNSDYVDSDNVLQFYWLIRSANVTDFDGSIYLYHADALESFDNTQGLDLGNYAPARLLNSSSAWDKQYSEGLFDEVNNVIMFKTNSTTDYADFTSNEITGTYTAGITRDNSDASLCGGAIPDLVPEYITLTSGTSGSISDIGSFATADGGTVPSLGESPDLTIAGDFTLDLTSQYWRFRKVTIEEGATLTITGAGVNLGSVEGTGTLKLLNTNALPAGDYASFESDAGCTQGGILELEVTTGNSVDLALPFNNLRGLKVSGDGEKVITNGTSFDICEDLEILDAGTLTMGDNTTLRIKGDIIKDPSAAFDGDYSNARIILNGTSQQTIDGAFESTEAISYLQVNNSAGVTIVNSGNDNVEVEDLVMTSGKITTDANNSLIILNTGSITGNFSSTTFVNGPLLRRLETSTDRQLFPVGWGSVYLPFEVSNTQGYVGTKDWTVQYHDEDPGTTTRITNINASYDFTTWGGEINDAKSKLFRQDLFEVEVVSPATADVRPYWDSDTDVGTSSQWQYLRVMVWDVTNEIWESYGNGNLNYSGMSTSSGSVVSDTDLSFSTNFVTLGSNEPVPLPVEFVFFKGRLLEDGMVMLEWQTASEINNDRFEIQRIDANGEFETIGTVYGAGDSNELLDYHFKDKTPYRGINYYRLKQIDFDGQFDYSALIMVDNDSFYKGLNVTVYPNPVSGDKIEMIINTGDELTDVHLVLMDASGRILQKDIKQPQLGAGIYEMNFSNSEIGSGLFYLVVVQGENKRVLRVIVQ